MNPLLWSNCIPLSPTKRLVWTELVQDCWNVSFLKCSLVTELLNLLIRKSGFPEIWKCSKVTTLFKSGDQTNASNYHPISILPTLSKILKRAVHFQRCDYPSTNHYWPTSNLVSDLTHLTVTAPASFADDILSNMEQWQESLVELCSWICQRLSIPCSPSY